MQKGAESKPIRNPHSQNRPGIEKKMQPLPVSDRPSERGSGKLEGKVALITGGDTGIGKAVAILFAKEEADVAIMYLNKQVDAEDTVEQVEHYGKKCLLIPGDISKEKNCIKGFSKAIKAFGKIDILVNSAALHYESKSLLAIINTTSVTAYRGSSTLLDYASSKSAIVSFIRSLSANLIEKQIRVNAVAPGPIWTPLIAASFKPQKVAKHGSDVPMKRAGEPAEVAPAYLFLASNDASYITGQVILPNGGEIVNG